jgi:DNA-binding transcriptional LysR family regulator
MFESRTLKKWKAAVDRLDAMSVFVSVVKHGSFSAASRELRMPLPTVSRKVSDLESHLGTRLLVRSTRKLVLTEAGEAYVAASKRILEEVAEAERAASGEYRAPRGELTLTAPIVFGRFHVLPVVAEFLKRHPEVDVRLSLADRSMDLIDDGLDIALRIGTVPEHLVAVRVGQIRSVVCATPAYLKEHGTPKSPDELARHQCIDFSGFVGAGSWMFRDGQTTLLRARLTVNTAEAAIDGALAGLGLTRVLSYQVDDALKAGKLVSVLRRYEPPPVPVNLIYQKEMRVTAKVRAFIDFAVPKLRARLHPR